MSGKSTCGKGGGLRDFLQPTVPHSIFRRERTTNLFSEARRVRYLSIEVIPHLGLKSVKENQHVKDGIDLRTVCTFASREHC